MYSLKTVLAECELLLEYKRDKTIQQHGAGILKRLESLRTQDTTHSVEYEAKLHQAGNRPDEALKHVMDHIEKSDPSPQKKNVPAMARMYAKGGAKFEDLEPRLGPALHQHMELSRRGKIPPEHRDAGRLKTLDDVENLVDQYKDVESENEKSKAHNSEMREQATVTEHDKYTHVIPHTFDAANHFGNGTRWCTTGSSGKGMYDHYTESGPLQIFIPKKPHYKGEKYQYHYSTDQLMNERDHPVYSDDANISSHGINQHISKYKAEADAASMTKAGLSHPESKVQQSALKNAHDITHQDLHDIIDKNLGKATRANYNTISSLLDNPRVDHSHLKKLADANGQVPYDKVAKHPNNKFTADDIHSYINSDADSYHMTSKVSAFLDHPNANHDHFNAALNSEHKNVVVEAAAKLPKDFKLTDDHINRIAKSNGINYIADRKEFNVETHGVTAIKNTSGYNRDSFIDKLRFHPDFDKAVKNIVDSGHVGATKAILNRASGFLSDEDHNTLLNHKNATIVRAAMASKNADDGKSIGAHNEEWSSHENPTVRAIYARNTHSDEHLDRAQRDPKPEVRWAALENKNASERHVEHASNDPHWEVRARAAGHKSASDDVVSKLKVDTHPSVRAVAKSNGKSSESDRTSNYAMTLHGKEGEHSKLKAIKSYVRMHNKSSDTTKRLNYKDRLGRNNPNAEHYRNAVHRSVKRGHGQRTDVYVHVDSSKLGHHDRDYYTDHPRLHESFNSFHSK